MIVLVRTVVAIMRVIVGRLRIVQSVVDMIVAVPMIVRVGMRMRVRVAVRMGMREVAMPVLVRMNMSVAMLMRMLVGMAVQRLMRVPVLGVVVHLETPNRFVLEEMGLSETFAYRRRPSAAESYDALRKSHAAELGETRFRDGCNEVAYEHHRLKGRQIDLRREDRPAGQHPHNNR